MGTKRGFAWLCCLVGIVAIAAAGIVASPRHAGAQTPSPAYLKAKIEELGKRVFFDKISVPQRMACVTCHDPVVGGTLKNAGTNLHQVAVTGADPHTAGGLKPPTNAYATLIPPFDNCAAGFYRLCGGNFWNGRSEGNDNALFPAGSTQHIGEEVFQNIPADYRTAYLGFLGPSADQALNPFPNPVEQNIEEIQVCRSVAASKYAPLFAIVWGQAIDCSENPYGTAGFKAYEVNYRRIAVAISAFQASREINSFSSKRDKALKNDADGKFPLDGFTEQENRGHDLFYGVTSALNPQGKNAGCAACHLSSLPDGTGEFERYTEDAYHNIGTPANPEIPGYPVPNPGLAGHTGINNPIQTVVPVLKAVPLGFHKTPTLRNVDKRPGPDFPKAYTHNGWFKSLESIVHFYNTAFLGNAARPYETTTAFQFGITRCDPSVEWTEEDALLFNCWPVPEVVGPGIGIGVLLGDQKLTSEEEAAVVSYMKTFTDAYTVKAPAPYK